MLWTLTVERSTISKSDFLLAGISCVHFGYAHTLLRSFLIIETLHDVHIVEPKETFSLGSAD